MRLLKVALAGLAFLLLSPSLLHHWHLNRGLLALGRSVRLAERWQTPMVDQAAVQQAEVYLRQATSILPGNYSAGRGLGMALALLGREEEALTTWEESRDEGMRGLSSSLIPQSPHPGQIAADFAQYAEAARQDGRYEEALVWFRRAYQLEPTSAVYAYYTGLMHERLEQWREAETIYWSALDTVVFAGFGRSDFYYRLGLLYQWRFAPPELDEAESAYQAAQQGHDFHNRRNEADTSYRLGELYENKGLEPKQYLAYYRRAVALDPAHYWAHLRLGHALYQTTGDLAAAVAEIDQALAWWPAEPSRQWPYRILGDLYREAGMMEEAIAAYKEAQRWQPADDYAPAAWQELSP
ncbi:MAG: hypothetical protein AB1791_23700 [Chloroflexota bacterium]